MAVASAFLASCFTVINGQFTKRHNGYLVTFWEMIGAWLSTALFLPLYSVIFGAEVMLFHVTALDLLWLLVLAVVCTVYAYSASVELQKKLTAFTVNLSVNMEPVYGIILAFFIFNEAEEMSSGFFAGTGLILLSVLIYPALVKWNRRKQLRVRHVQ
jgi:drug/metabolite transporter (DMT)-like permease